MREKQLCVVVTFYTTADAMALERQCNLRAIPGKLFSAPRTLSSDCGIAWQSPIAAKAALEALLAERGIEIHGIHELRV